ncbi:muconolactone Delta-isomerase family protein [uncultured Ruegeria sp.]|uniref:muconolactone Delta-isomerase n=1 Tax=uncultured Ruegeria sp. TaxID=259304 RepID=UPI002637E74B|nr:muconolactone Delta-isomerase family protein [uncultured Ruegeria sp.]
MLFLVKMSVDWPRDMPPDEASALQKAERAYSANLQRKGVWKHLWRTTGIFGNISVFDVQSHEELHEVITGLPFYPYITLDITPLSQHPGRIEDI